MISEELVFFPFLYIKLFEHGVKVAFNNRSAVTHHKVNLLKFPLWSSSFERTDDALVLLICFKYIYIYPYIYVYIYIYIDFYIYTSGFATAWTSVFTSCLLLLQDTIAACDAEQVSTSMSL